MKAKTHSGTKKRVKITGTGKFVTEKIGKRHLLQNKSTKAKGRNKYGIVTHVANEQKMKWGHKVPGLRKPTKKTAAGAIIKTPRRAPVIKAVTPVVAKVKTQKVAAPKAVKAPKATASAPKKSPAKKKTQKAAE